MLQIFRFLPKEELCKAARVCWRWRRVAYDSSLWRTVNIRRFQTPLDEFRLIRLVRSRMIPLLQRLNIGGLTLSPRVFQVLVKSCKQLKTLCLESTTFVEDFTDSADSFPENLTQLDIRHSSGDPTAFRKIAQCLRRLQCLGLSDTFFESLKTEAEKVDTFVKLEAIKILEFSYCALLTDQMVQCIAKHCTSIRSLCLRRCNNIQGESLSSLIDNCPTLASLVLDGTSVSDDAVIRARWETSVITEVDLSWCRHLTHTGLKSMLPRCRFLRYLRLCCCGYGHATTDDVLSAMMEHNCSSLQVLDLSYSSEVTNAALGRFVASCPSLIYLRVYHCQMLTSALMDLIPSTSQVFVVANFALQRGGMVTTASLVGPWTTWSAPASFARRISLDDSMQW